MARGNLTVILLVSCCLIGCGGGSDLNTDEKLITQACQGLAQHCLDQPHLNDLNIFGVEDAGKCETAMKCLRDNLDGACLGYIDATLECLKTAGSQTACPECDDAFTDFDKNCECPEPCRDFAVK